MRTPYLAMLVVLLAGACAVESQVDGRPVNATCVAAEEPPATLADTGCFEGPKAEAPVEGVIPYEVRVPLWSDGADKRRWLALPEGGSLHVERDGDLTLPVGGVLIKAFSVKGRRLETRFLVRKGDGTYDAYAYAFGTRDGVGELAIDGAEVSYGDGQRWKVPGRDECFECHTEASGVSLGLELAQLGDQVDNLERLGLFDRPLDEALRAKRLPALDGTDSIERRAKAYLHANCSFCHRPGGMGFGSSDLRYETPFAFMNLCDAPAEHDDGDLPDAVLLTPGDASRSLLTLRMRSLMPLFRMPPLASDAVDERGTKIVEAWVNSLGGCPEPR